MRIINKIRSAMRNFKNSFYDYFLSENATSFRQFILIIFIVFFILFFKSIFFDDIPEEFLILWKDIFMYMYGYTEYTEDLFSPRQHEAMIWLAKIQLAFMVASYETLLLICLAFFATGIDKDNI